MPAPIPVKNGPPVHECRCGFPVPVQFQTCFNCLPRPRVAHVGWTGSEADKGRIVMAQCILADLHVTYRHHKSEPDLINLHNGRDFLAEEHPYDLVITHWVFKPNALFKPEHVPSAMLRTGADLRFSKLNSDENWSKRLDNTGALWAIAFGGLAEVTAGAFWMNQHYRYALLSDQKGATATPQPYGVLQRVR